jgi:hypothetical protein
LRTYGSSSRSTLASGSHRYSVILSTRMHPMVRTASARISGLGSCESCRRECRRQTRYNVRARARDWLRRYAELCAKESNLDEGVDGHDGEVRLCFGVVDAVQVHELLQLQVVRLHAVHHVREESRHVLAHRHGRDHCTRPAPRQLKRKHWTFARAAVCGGGCFKVTQCASPPCIAHGGCRRCVATRRAATLSSTQYE